MVLLALAVLGCAVYFGLSSLNAPPSSGITVYYFYGKECPSCHNTTPFVESLRQKYPDVRFELLEIWHDDNNNALYKLKNHELGKPLIGVPEAIVGDVVLLGETDITTKLESTILNQKKKLTESPGMEGTLSQGRSAGTNNTITATEFYGIGCSHCENIKPLLAELQAKYPELSLERLEINQNKTNLQKFIDMSNQYGLASAGSVPAVFIGSHVAIGETEVRDHFEEYILVEKQRLASGIPANQTLPTPEAQPAAPAISPFMVVFAALVDSTNPCGLSVLVFLLISMAAAGNRKRILLVGGTYIAAMFLFHLLVGIGLFSALALSGLTRPFSLIGGAIALILGIVTLADVLRNKETYLLSIPESGKGMLGTYIRKATVPAAFVLGILAGILGFSCTGGIYISILGLMGRDMTVMAGLPWLILYNLVFILPLVLITLLVAYGISPERAERWRTENKRMIRVIIGLIMVALGLVILLGGLG